LLEVSNTTIGKLDGRLRTFAEFGSQWLSAGGMFEPSVSKTLKALEAIGVDGRARRYILVEERDDGLGLEVRDRFHSDVSRPPAPLFHRHQNQRRSPTLELSAPAEASLLAADPRFIDPTDALASPSLGLSRIDSRSAVV